MGALNFAILNHQCVTLATILTEDSSTIESEVEILGECTGWITEKADLYIRMNWESIIGQDWVSYLSLGGWVKGCAPGFHAKRLLASTTSQVRTC